MKDNNTILDIIKVTISNLCIVFSGVFVGFLIPKVLGVTEYGYYKIFTLYATYVGIFSFGISEGVYLRYSGTKYDDLDKNKITYFTRLVFCVQIIIAIVMLAGTLFFLKAEYRYIFISLTVYMLVLNMTTYYQYIAQMTMRFNDYSMRNIIKSIFTVISVIIMLGLYYYNKKQNMSYRYYLFFVVLIAVILFVMYVKKFSDITFGKIKCIEEYLPETKQIIKIGIPFLVASLCATLILTIDRQFVSIYFNTKTYGIYAFAYNMLSLVTVCTAAISTVIYPTLKNTKKDEIKIMYPKLSSYVLCFVFLALNGYYPLVLFIKWFLPQYTYSLEIFRIVFPGLAFSSVISVVIQNYYKLLNRNDLFFYQNIFILIISVIANFIAYYIFRTPSAISCASIITLIIYYIITEYYFRKKFRVAWKKNFVYAILMTIIFYIVTMINNEYIGFILYFIAFIGVVIILQKNVVNEVVQFIKKGIDKNKE